MKVTMHEWIQLLHIYDFLDLMDHELTKRDMVVSTPSMNALPPLEQIKHGKRFHQKAWVESGVKAWVAEYKPGDAMPPAECMTDILPLLLEAAGKYNRIAKYAQDVRINSMQAIANIVNSKVPVAPSPPSSPNTPQPYNTYD